MKKLFIAILVSALLAPMFTACDDYKCKDSEVLCIAECLVNCGCDKSCAEDCSESSEKAIKEGEWRCD